MATLLFSSHAFAGDVLDGKTYCRTFQSDGSFGQPKGESKHCLSFADGSVTDGANTHFGNPPESFEYNVKGNVVTFEDSKYKISSDHKTLTTVKGSTTKGTKFTLEK